MMLMSSSFWKCLFSTSRMARAKPHMKKSEVISTNGTMYCLLLSDTFLFSIILDDGKKVFKREVKGELKGELKGKLKGS